MANPPADRLDVMIVGAGPTGLTLAAQLQVMGASFRIVDRQPDRVQESRALAIQPRTLEVLRGLDATRELLGRGNDAVWLRLHAGGRAVRVRLFGLGLADTAFPFRLFVSQAETEAVLIDRLAAGGARVERRVELVAFTVHRDRVACALGHPDGRTEQVAARYLVGCDGASSDVRRGAGIAFQGGAYPQTFVLADLEIDGGLDDDALLDAYDAERRPVGRFVVRFTDRAFSAATSTNPDRLPARDRLPAQPGRAGGPPQAASGPRAGDRLPDARITRNGQACWLGEALAAPRFHLPLCGPTGAGTTASSPS